MKRRIWATTRVPNASRVLPPSPRSQTRRAGFTLIELLIAIFIIAILAALLLPAAFSAYRSGKRTQAVTEISQLGLGLEAFKNEFGIYPPSRIRLRENTAYNLADGFDATSVRYLKMIWPDIALATYRGTVVTPTAPQCHLWVKDSNTKTEATVAASAGTAGTPGSANGATYELEGYEALVFFLGGIPEFDGTARTSGSFSTPVVLHGFSRRQGNPGGTPDPADPVTIARKGPFFDFAANRLILRDNMGSFDDSPVGWWHPTNPATGMLTAAADRKTVQLPCYQPLGVTEKRGYAYFSGYEGQGYRPNDCVSDEPNPANYSTFQLLWPTVTTLGNHPIVPGPNPYCETNPDAGNIGPPIAPPIVRVYKKDTYQIISPGADGLYGSGGGPAGPKSGKTLSEDDPNADNLSNVSGGQTVIDWNNQ